MYLIIVQLVLDVKVCVFDVVVGCCRLLVLRELIPLVSHFSQLKQDLQSWLCDISADVEALDGAPGDITPDTDDHAEQLRMCRYNVKVPA